MTINSSIALKILVHAESNSTAFEGDTVTPILIKARLGTPQPAFTCSKLSIETLKQGVKYVQSLIFVQETLQK